MKITDIKSSCFRVPVFVPLRKEPKYWSMVIVEIKTDNGLIGYGLTGYGTKFSLNNAINEFINYNLAPFLKGANPLETEKIWNNLYKTFNIRSATGVWSQGVSAIDIALWDIKGHFFGEPVARLLGGASMKVPAYITYGLEEYSIDELIEVGKSFINEGQDKIKLVVARLSGVKEDAERIKAVREAVGDDIEIMIDANYLYSFIEAQELCKKIEPYNITWFEEPVYGNDWKLLADLRKKFNIPIAAGQNLGHIWNHRELIVNSAIDISQPNVCFVGGYTEGLKVANLARAFNLPIANGGGWPHHNMHLQAAVSNGWRVEFHLLMWKAAEVIFKNLPQPVNGWVEIPDKPGLGFEPIQEALDEYRIK